jgi:hypothetical protein
MENSGSHRVTAPCAPIRLKLAVLDATAREPVYKGAKTACAIVLIKTVADVTSVLIDPAAPALVSRLRLRFSEAAKKTGSELLTSWEQSRARNH